MKIKMDKKKITIGEIYKTTDEELKKIHNEIMHALVDNTKIHELVKTLFPELSRRQKLKLHVWIQMTIDNQRQKRAENPGSYIG